VAALLLAGSGSSAAERAPLRALPAVVGPGDQRAAAVSGSRLVYEELRDGTWDVLMTDLGTGATTVVADGPGDQRNPDVDGDRVVWQDSRTGTWDVYQKDLRSGASGAVYAGAGDQVNPAVSGTRVVWQDSRNGNWDVFAKDLATGIAQPIIATSAPQTNPDISGARIAWEEFRRDAAGDIYLKDLDSGCEFQIAGAPGPELAPSVSGPVVAWEDHTAGGPRIVLLDLSTQQEWSVPGDADRRNPALSDAMVAWIEGGDLFVQDRTSGGVRAVTAGTGARSTPSVSGTRVAWQEDASGADLYWTEVGPPRVALSRPRAGSLYAQDAELARPSSTGPSLVLGLSVTLEATATDAETDVTSYEFDVDGATVCSGPASTCPWTVAAGTHVVTVTAADRAGNVASSSTSVVAV
jgi:beta propeller repeat protein